MKKDQVSQRILIFALGAGIGAAVALLFAPKSGGEVRGDIADSVNNGVDHVRSAGKDLKRRANKVLDQANEQVRDAIDAGERAYSQAKNA